MFHRCLTYIHTYNVFPGITAREHQIWLQTQEFQLELFNRLVYAIFML